MIKNLKNSTVTSMDKPTSHRKKQYVTNAFKYLLAVSSMAGTLGIWNLLANKDLANAQSNSDGQTPPVTNFDPLPTLVPILSVDLSSLQRGGGGPSSVAVVATDAAPLREVARPVATAAVSPVILSGANASSNSSGNQSAPTVNSSAPVVNAPNPVTTTQSSKP